MRRVILFASAALSLLVLTALSGNGLPRPAPGLPVKDQAATTSEPASPPGEILLAARYHQRNRTKAFFERAAQSQVREDRSKSAALLPIRGKGAISIQPSRPDSDKLDKATSRTLSK